MKIRQDKCANPYIKLKMWMIENNIRQADVAELIEKSLPTFNQNINGKSGDLTWIEMRKICKEYNVSADDFF